MKVKAEKQPKIEIIVPQHVEGAKASDIRNKIIQDHLQKEEGKYSYGLERYLTQYEKYFLYYNTIKIYYEIEGESYISLFGLVASNANEGTDFFNNEPLEEPLEPDID